MKDSDMDISEPPRKIIKKEIYSATVEAQSILETARREADLLARQAEQQREHFIELGRQAGYEEGLTRWNEALLEFSREHEQLLKDSEQAVLKLAVRLAEKIIGQQLLLSPQTIVDIVREGLKSLRSDKSVSVKVNPTHLETLRNSIARLQDLLGPDCRVRFVADPGISPGGCTIESELGVIDAQIETQLKCLEEALKRVSRK